MDGERDSISCRWLRAGIGKNQHFSTEFNCTLHRMKFKLGSTCARSSPKSRLHCGHKVNMVSRSEQTKSFSVFSQKQTLLAFLSTFSWYQSVWIFEVRFGLVTLARSVSDNDTFSIQTVVCQSTKELIHYGIVRKIVPTIAAEGLTSVLKVTYLYENTHQESICVQIP